MSRGLRLSWGVLLAAAGLMACSAQQPSAAKPNAKGGAASSAATASTTPLSGTAGAPSGAGTLIVSNPGSTQPSAAGGAVAGSGAVLSSPGKSADTLSCANVNGPFKPEGCSCKKGETSACWTGPVADRNMGACHDGLQVCDGSPEFATWGKCMGEELSCGVDAGMPPPDEDCTCIPGAIIQCSEDCSVGIICSLTATKTCLPDGTWSTCSEGSGAQLDAPGLQCRNMLHGCVPPPDDGSELDNTGAGELFVGDCSKQFKCGHSPPPPPPPVMPQ